MRYKSSNFPPIISIAARFLHIFSVHLHFNASLINQRFLMKTHPRIIVAMDSLKGSADSHAAGQAVARGLADAWPEADVSVLALGDGGEGTAPALAAALHGQPVHCTVPGPLGARVEATYYVCHNTVVMDMAQASGLCLVEPVLRNPLRTSSAGTGTMIMHAVVHGCREIILGIGGSATVDGGMGMLSAMGALFTDKDGKMLQPCGAALPLVARADLSGVPQAVRDVRITVACDVNNALCGPQGAARVFGPQKGAAPEDVEELDAGLSIFADAIDRATGTDMRRTEGAGAAGGIGYALAAVTGARLTRGIDLVLDTLGFDSLLRGASLVVTGEGCLDRQTLMGKAPCGVLRRARMQGVPVVALGGRVTDAGELLDAGFAAVLPIVEGPCPLCEAIRPDTALDNLRRTALMVGRLAGLMRE